MLNGTRSGLRALFAAGLAAFIIYLTLTPVFGVQNPIQAFLANPIQLTFYIIIIYVASLLIVRFAMKHEEK